MYTGIFFYYQQGERLKDFPDALSRTLNRPNVFFYDAFYPLKPASSFDLEPIPPESLYKVHTPQMIRRVMATGDYEGAMYSAAGTVSAAIKAGAGEINIHVPSAVDDDTYLSLFRDALRQRVRAFHPEILFWNWGYDGTTGEYGDMRLTAEVHVRLALELKRLAGEVCKGRLIVILCGGSRRDLASMIIPGVVEVLANASSGLTFREADKQSGRTMR